MNDILEIQEAIEKPLYDEIRNIIFHPSFAWYWLETPTKKIEESKIDVSSFNNTIYHITKQTLAFPNLTNFFDSAISVMAKRYNFNYDKLFRIRIALLPRKQSNVINAAHIDHDEPHNTMLIYFSTCDAPTLIYENVFNHKNNEKLNSSEYLKKYKDEVVLKKLIPCIENTAVVFNGMRYHSSSFPTNVDRRIVATINFE